MERPENDNLETTGDLLKWYIYAICETTQMMTVALSTATYFCEHGDKVSLWIDKYNRKFQKLDKKYEAFKETVKVGTWLENEPLYSLYKELALFYNDLLKRTQAITKERVELAQARLDKCEAEHRKEN